MELSFSTWNILANRFTNYNLGQKKNEDNLQMKNRYLSIILILKEHCSSSFIIKDPYL